VLINNEELMRPKIFCKGGFGMIADLERLSQTWNRAWLEKDAAVVEKMMADEYVFVAANGQLLDRQTILKVIRSASYRLDRSTRTEVIIKPVGNDSAAVVFRSQAEGVYEGKSFKDDHRCTTLCARRGAEWQIVMEHCSPNNQ
jgi:ketosteroid isomerase-like protein